MYTVFINQSEHWKNLNNSNLDSKEQIETVLDLNELKQHRRRLIRRDLICVVSETGPTLYDLVL